MSSRTSSILIASIMLIVFGGVSQSTAADTEEAPLFPRIRPIPLMHLRNVDLAVYIWYIEGANSRILVDAGIDETIAFWVKMGGWKISSLDDGLARVGLTPEDVDIVIFTHLHPDHRTYTKRFTNARLIAQSAELEFYKGNPFLKDLDFDTISGDQQIDDNVQVLLTPGHTPGGQSVLVETAAGKVVITGFCCAMGNFEPTINPMPFGSSDQFIESMQRVEKIADILVPLHDSSFIDIDAIPMPRGVEAADELYPKLRESVIKDNNQSALVKLAGYQKEQDMELILNNWEESKSNESKLYSTYLAIANYPHPDFLPLLEGDLRETLDNTHWKIEWANLYRAIARYQNAKALGLLETPFTQLKNDNMREYHLDFLFGAINEFRAPIYDDLLWRLWEGGRITLNTFEYLYGKNPEKSLDLTGKSLQNLLNLSGLIAAINEDLIQAMLDFMLKMDRDFALEIIRKNINEADVTIFPILANKVIELKDNSFVEPLFERLGKESDSCIYLEIAKALIAYKDKEINQRMLNAREKNENLRSGLGAESLEKFMKENQIE